MPVLRAFFTGLGFSDVRTLLQTGNIIFRSEARNANDLERLLESEAKAQLGLDTDFFVRSANDWEALVDANPFPDEAKSDPRHLVVMFLKDAPNAKSLEALRASIRGPEVVNLKGRQAYIVYPAGIGRSRRDKCVGRSQTRHPRHRPELEHCTKNRRSRRSVRNSRRKTESRESRLRANRTSRMVFEVKRLGSTYSA